MRRIASLVALLAAFGPWQGWASEPAGDRASAYTQYRAAFDAGLLDEALPHAMDVVELTAKQYGEEAIEMASPLTNLATTQYRLEQLGEALTTYRRALLALDPDDNSVDPRLAEPLHGIGMTLRAMQRCGDAIFPLERAIDILRIREGLNSEAQLPAMRALIDCYERTGRRDEAGSARMYVFNAAERTFGPDDPRMVMPLTELAQWYETTARLSGARVIYLRAVQVADQAQPGNIAAVDALRGLARTKRMLAFRKESGLVAAQILSELPGSVVRAKIANFMGGPSDEGELALRDALDRLQAAGPAKAALRGALLLELGEMHFDRGKDDMAMESWRAAWSELAAAGDTAALEMPAPLQFDPPRSLQLYAGNPKLYTVEDVLVRVSIAANGKVKEAMIVNPDPARRQAERDMLKSARNSIWRPAFSDGRAVAYPDLLFSQGVFVRRPDRKPPEQGP